MDSGRHIRLVAVTLIATSANGVSVESKTDEWQWNLLLRVCLFVFFCFLFSVFLILLCVRISSPATATFFNDTTSIYRLSSLFSSLPSLFFIIFYIFPPPPSFEFSFSAAQQQQCRTLRGICVWAQRAVIPLSSLFWWYTNGYLVPFLPGRQAVNSSQTFYIIFFSFLLSPLPSKTSFFLSFFSRFLWFNARPGGTGRAKPFSLVNSNSFFFFFLSSFADAINVRASTHTHNTFPSPDFFFFCVTTTRWWHAKANF